MNWRRMIAAGLVTGMLAVTGCSSNLPETNQGNRNGQRVVDAVNRRGDTYGSRPTRGLFGRTTRGFNRAARNVGDGITGNRANRRYNRMPNRSTSFGRPQNRIGNTFHYGANHGRTAMLDEGFDGFDRGVTMAERNTVNNRVVGNHNTNRNIATNPTNTNGRYGMNRTERGIPRSGVNRATRRAHNRTNNTNLHRNNYLNRNNAIGVVPLAEETVMTSAINNDGVAISFDKIINRNKQQEPAATPAPAVPNAPAVPAPAKPAPTTYDDTHYERNSEQYNYEQNSYDSENYNYQYEYNIDNASDTIHYQSVPYYNAPAPSGGRLMK